MSNILIVGANRGIGYYMAIRLLEKGNNVTVLDIQDDHISELKKRYQNSLLIIRSDATDEDSLSEGIKKSIKEFGNVNAVPICLDTQDTEEIIQAVKNIAPGFGGINLEDISAPRCFEIEERLKEMLDIPVFHDDQHGTAIVVLAGIINGLRVTGKKKEDCRVVVNGAGSAGVAITKLLLTYGFKHVTMCDREGIIGKEEKA